MGWRVSQAYDVDRRAALRALPLRERYAWRRIAWVLIAAAMIATVAVATRM